MPYLSTASIRDATGNEFMVEKPSFRRFTSA